MKRFFLKTAKYLRTELAQCEQIRANQDLADLHKTVVRIMNTLPENIVHENAPLFLGGLEVNRIEKLNPYLDKLEARLTDLLNEYMEKGKK